MPSNVGEINITDSPPTSNAPVTFPKTRFPELAKALLEISNVTPPDALLAGGKKKKKTLKHKKKKTLRSKKKKSLRSKKKKTLRSKKKKTLKSIKKNTKIKKNKRH